MLATIIITHLRDGVECWTQLGSCDMLVKVDAAELLQWLESTVCLEGDFEIGASLKASNSPRYWQDKLILR